MKACEIYKTKKSYKIATMYRTDTWIYISNEPIFILPIDVAIEEFKNTIFKSLEASKEIPYPEESLSKEFLKSMKESSFMSLYKNSSNCNIYFEDNIIEIQPNKCINPREGLFPVNEDIVKIPYSKDKEMEIVNEIIKILDHKYE